MDRTGLDESAVVERHGAVRGGRREAARGFAAWGGEMWPSSRQRCSRGPGRGKAADAGGDPLEGVKGTGGEKGR